MSYALMNHFASKVDSTIIQAGRLNQKGEVLFFEANPRMAIIPPGTETRWDYRRPAAERMAALQALS
jgi:hypothetical protein